MSLSTPEACPPRRGSHLHQRAKDFYSQAIYLKDQLKALWGVVCLLLTLFWTTEDSCDWWTGHSFEFQGPFWLQHDRKTNIIIKKMVNPAVPCYYITADNNDVLMLPRLPAWLSLSDGHNQHVISQPLISFSQCLLDTCLRQNGQIGETRWDELKAQALSEGNVWAIPCGRM